MERQQRRSRAASCGESGTPALGPYPARDLRLRRARRAVHRSDQHLNNLWYREHISATNPCGEIPLPAYGACDLGSINLTRFVDAPFTPQADSPSSHSRKPRALPSDCSITSYASRFPLPRQAENANGSRRIGLGITGLADALVMLGLAMGVTVAYGGCRSYGAHLSRRVSCLDRAGGGKGKLSLFRKDKYLEGAFIRACQTTFGAGIAESGIRNSHLIAIAPTGTISLLAGNVSSGLEPVFARSYGEGSSDERDIRKNSRSRTMLQLWRETKGPAEDLRRHLLRQTSCRCSPILTFRRPCSPSLTTRFPRRSTWRRISPSPNSAKSMICL